MKVWITGAGGMMGSHLAEMLLADGHDVLATYFKPTIDPQDLRLFKSVEVNVSDWCSVHDSLSAFRPDAVYHLAAQSYPTVSWERPVETLTANVIGTATVFEALRRIRPDARIVVAGSSAEYGILDGEGGPVTEGHNFAPLHPYGVSKVATELLARQYHASYGMNAVVVRIFNCTGPRKTGDAVSDFVRRCVWLERHPDEKTVRVGNLSTKRTIVDVRDLNRAMIMLLDKGTAGTAYNLGGTTVYEMGEILNLVIAESRRRDVFPEVDHTLLRPTDEKIIWGDCTKLRNEIGWSTRIPLQQTIADMFAYWRTKNDPALLA
jgi:GDP-4-dehydro-6-deoxy-D-mannose reductase